MKARLSLVITIAATMLWSCQFDDVLSTPSDEGVIRVTSSLTKAESTGGTNESTTNDNFKNGEIIYVWASKTGGSSTDDYIKAWKLTATGTNGGFTGESKAWPYDGKNLDFHALHGNFNLSDLNDKNWSVLTSLKHTVLTDQRSDENRRKSDLLYAERTRATHGNNVELSFSHILAKITVKLDLKNSMGITPADFENASVSILRIQPEAYFKSSSKDASTSGGTEIEINAGTIDKPSELTSEAYYAGSAIVPLQTIAAEQQLIKISLKNRTFIYKASANTEFQKGQEYTYTLIIRGQQITGSLSVSDFTPEDKNIPFEDKLDYLSDLKNRTYLGSSTDPHDLSYDYNGLMNTANCYVVTHPGYYKIPLVYGNAIKNGATNAIAYGSSTFVNHLGNQITDPYIYNNKDNNEANLSAGSAELVWQDAQYLIRNIDLCDESKYIKFEITKENIEQGNALIAVKDGAGTIMWSWHIWVTNKNIYETVPIQTVALTTPVTTTQKTYNFMPVTLGLDDDDPVPNCTYYQWGRKDPFCPSTATKNDKSLYDISGATISFSTESSIVTTAESIKKPQTFYTAPSDDSYDWNSTTYYDYWNAANGANMDMNDNDVIKTVYDPNPVGFKMPSPDAFTVFTEDGSNQNDDKTKWNVENTTIVKGYSFYTQGWHIGPINFWWATGFRAYNTGFSGNIGNGCDYWTAGPHTNSRGRSFHFCVGHISPQSANYRAYGFCVRPISE